MKKTFKQWPVLLMAGALVVAPMLNPIVAQAAPATVPANIPPGLSKDKPGDNVTLSGVVTRDLTGNQFVFLADDGRTFRVISRGNGENGVANGDRVQVQGRRNNREHDVINATSVTKINVANPNEGMTLNGVVTRDLAGDQFLFRDDEGRAFRVVAPKGEPNWLSKDDRIEVRGRRDRNERDLIYADSIRPLKGSVGNPGENVTLNGAVTRDLPGNQFDFRSDDGLLFRVIARTPGENKLANGDRVEVSGKRDKVERDVIHADTVRPLKDGNQASNSQFGVVTRNLTGNRFEMRAGDGRLITVTMRGSEGEPNRLSVGDTVRVERMENSTDPNSIISDHVTIVKDLGQPGTVGKPGTVGQNADLSGVAMRIEGRTRLDVRADNGHVYSVTSDDRFSSDLKNGQRVRVTGKWSSATTVRADKVVLEVQDNPGAENGAINFWGKVQSANNNGLIRDLKVVGDNGWVYSVQYRNLQSFRVGDRVHVIGAIANGMVNATSVSTR